MATITTSETTVHPLRAAIDALETELEAATEAHDALCDDDSVTAEDAIYIAASEHIELAQEWLDAAREELAGSDCPRDWALTEKGYEYDTITAESAEEALEEARSNVDRSNYNDAEGTLYIDIRVDCEESGESETGTVTLEAEEPECSHDDGHDWQSPYSLLGGLKENPGVWGHGGGVIIREVCLRCGCEKVTDTWAQRRDTGEQGLTEVSYETEKHEVTRFKICDLVSEVRGAGCSEAREAAAWLLFGVRSILAGDGYNTIPDCTEHHARIEEALAFVERAYRAVSRENERRAVRLAIRFAAFGNSAETQIAEAVISAILGQISRKAA
jgi:hypothetical protein